MSQIFDNVWIAPADTVRDIEFLHENGITHVLNCADEEPTRYPDPYLVAHKEALTDDNDPAALGQLLSAGAILATWAMNPMNRIVVHCKAGISRSVTVVLAWMIVHRNYTFDDAYLHVQRYRMFILPNPHYMRILRGLAGEQIRLSLFEEATPQSTPCT
jgi:predicted protein tyrosine phosphatase